MIYVLYIVCGIAGLLLIGIVFGFGVWLGHGLPTYRADKKLQHDWQRWYEEQESAAKRQQERISVDS